MHPDELFIGGSWLQASTEQRIEVVSPHSEQPVARIAIAGPADVDKAVAAARAAFDSGPWPTSGPRGANRRRSQARRALRRATLRDGRCHHLRDRRTDQLRPTRTGRVAVVNDDRVLRSRRDVSVERGRAGMYGADIHVRHEPVGVVAAIVPWNMPQFLIVTKLIPALLAGCTVVIKPAPESPLNALLLADLIAESDLPPGVVERAAGRRATVGDRLVKPPRDRQGLVHRIDGRGQGRRSGVRHRPAARQPRTGWQVRRHHPRGRRPRHRRGRRTVGKPVQQWSDLQCPDSHTRSRRSGRRLHRCIGRRDGVDDRRGPDGQRHPDGPARRPAPAGAGARLHRNRPARGRPPRSRRHRDARRSRSRLVCPADVVRRCRQHDADRSRGDLRSGADRSFPTPTRTMPWPSPMTPTTAWPARCGPTTPTAAWR